MRPSAHRPSLLGLMAAILLASAALPTAHAGQLRVYLEDPAPDRVLTAGGAPVETRGGSYVKFLHGWALIPSKKILSSDSK